MNWTTFYNCIKKGLTGERFGENILSTVKKRCYVYIV